MAGKSPPKSAEPSGELTTPRRQSVLRGLWIRLKLRPIRNLSIIAMVTGAVVLLGYGLRQLTSHLHAPKPDTEQMLETALLMLDENRFLEAREIAAALRLHANIPEEKRGIPPFVLGVAMQRDANEEWHPRERKSLFLLAGRYFDESRRAGFPPGREADGLTRLGESYHHCERYAEAIQPLAEAVEKNPERATELCGMLSECYLRNKKPDLQKAAEFNNRYLSSDDLPLDARHRAVLLQAQILFDLDQLAECEQVLESLPQDSTVRSSALLLLGRVLLREGDRFSTGSPPTDPTQTAKYSAAMEILKEAVTSGDRSEEFQSQAGYLLGLAYHRLGNATAAEEQFARVRRAYFDSPQGIAAGIHEAELKRLLGHDQESLDAFRTTLHQAARLKITAEPWISVEDLRKRVETVFNVYRQEQRFAEAADLISSLRILFPDVRTTEAHALIHEMWANELLQQAAANERDANTLTEQAREELRKAGELYEILARLRFSSRDYGDDLWKSAESYMKGRDFPNAVKMYRQFLANHDRGQRGAALVRMGEALLAMNHPEEALQSLNECIDFYPKDPFVYKARLIAANANLERDQLERAKSLLATNLENDFLTPQSREWRDSLYLLGRIHFREGVLHETQSRLKGLDSQSATQRQEGLKELRVAQDAFRQAIEKLSEAVERDPEARQAIESRYMIAQAYLQSARLPKKEIANATIETTRVTLRREMEEELTKAAAAFENLKNLLSAKQEKAELSPIEQRMLRNCYFARADALFDLEQYDEAIAAYSSATNRYQNEPEALEAYVQIANCHRKLSRLADARNTLGQAKSVLNRIRPDANFAGTTRYDRKEWVELLDWLSTL